MWYLLSYTTYSWRVKEKCPSSLLAAADISIPPDGRDELAVLRERGVGDLDLYYYNAPVSGDWTYWDAFARNPSPLARDFWIIPGSGGAKDIAAIGEGAGEKKLGVLASEGMDDANLYIYNNLVPGDWNYWDASSRNPSPVARDLWVIPSGDQPLTIVGIDSDGDGYDILLPKRELYGDRSLYLYNAPAQGDWTYWDAYSRNPSPIARDPRL